ncbi:MAG: ATP-binding cassette domain-containing protein [Betaproteobacteria bacterium]|nr:ATP-binding cassette domain-containing protein [Betaproteobacteria bacterium]
MALLHLQELCLAYGDVALLDHADFAIENNERIALIGRNGAGKSSLLKIIAGEIVADDGKVNKATTLRVALVPQEPRFEEGVSVFDAVAAGLPMRADLHAYHEAARRVSIAHDDESMEALAHWQQKLDDSNAWQYHSRVEETLSRLGLDADAMVDELSGGMKKRVALGRALVAAPDLLLLDEPTNHLDITGIEWLERTLSNYAGSTVVISHDRRFLETFATRIVELDRGKLASFPGSFADYQRRKAEMLNAESSINARFDKLLKEEEAWIRQGVEARRTRNEGRVRRLEQLRRERAARREQLGNVRFTLDAGTRSGKVVAALDGVSKGFGERTLIRNLTAVVQRGDRVGLIGPNGIGKTTLLKLILGDLEPDSGKIVRGTQLAVAYFDQMRAVLDLESTLSDVISPGSEFVEVGGGRKHIVGYLGEFLFPPQRARAKVKSLSGGERNRLLLARLFAQPANLLVLDEPTNDLDIETLELLESLLQDYAGTVLLVSHDRAFLDNVVTQSFAFEGDGVVRVYPGGYADWQQQRSGKETLTPVAVSSTSGEDRGRARKNKLSYNEARELDGLPAKIEALEQEQRAIEARLADGTLYINQADEARKLAIRREDLIAEAEQALARWDLLEQKKAAVES